jgi:hypothetical protein
MPETTTTVLDHVAERLMENAGHSREEDLGTAGEREWDPDDPSSQYSILRDVADAAIEATVEALGALRDDDDTDGALALVTTPPDADLATVAAWLGVCSSLGLPPGTPVSGSLSVPVRPLPVTPEGEPG